LLENHF